MSCPPQLSVERPEDRTEAGESPEAGTDISLASSTNISSPVKSSGENMVRGVDMTELVRKLSSQKQASGVMNYLSYCQFEYSNSGFNIHSFSGNQICQIVKAKYIHSDLS